MSVRAALKDAVICAGIIVLVGLAFLGSAGVIVYAAVTWGALAGALAALVVVALMVGAIVFCEGVGLID